jgi:phosphate transport system substrate-binding protein
MSDHDLARSGIWATAVAIVVLAISACSSGSTTTSSASTVPSFGSTGHRPTLAGAGSTFVAPFFSAAFAKYEQQHPGVTIDYSAVGSSAGIAAISAQQVDFGASDVPMTTAEQAAAEGGPITQIPDALSSEGIAYNLPLPAGDRLHLTGPVLAAIFLGQITRWNDPALTALNPGVPLPDLSITVVHRSDGSGTTYIFSDYLSAISPAWAAKVGRGKSLTWPVGDGAEGNGGVTSEVDRTPSSIGYIEQAYATGLLLPFAAIRNQAGNYVIPSAQTVTAAAAQKPTITPTDFSIVNQPGASSYPISGYSWALVYTHQPSQATGQALVTMLDWLTHAGQTDALANDYVPLPPQVEQLATTSLQQVTGPSGTHLLS